MENKRNDLINEIVDLKQRFNHHQDVYINFYYIIGDAKRFIKYYEQLFQRKKFNKNIRKTGYIVVLLIIIANICYAHYTVVLNPNDLAKFLIPVALSYSCLGLVPTIKNIVETSKKITEIENEITENKTKYEEQEAIIQTIPLYYKIQDDIGDYVLDLLEQITDKKCELFELNESVELANQPIRENIYQNPFKQEDESEDYSSTRNDIKKLVRIKK